MKTYHTFLVLYDVTSVLTPDSKEIIAWLKKSENLIDSQPTRYIEPLATLFTAVVAYHKRHTLSLENHPLIQEIIRLAFIRDDSFSDWLKTYHTFLVLYDVTSVLTPDSKEIIAWLKKSESLIDSQPTRYIEPLATLFTAVVAYHKRHALSLEKHPLIQEIIRLAFKGCNHYALLYLSGSKMTPPYGNLNEQMINEIRRWLAASYPILKAAPISEQQSIKSHLETLIYRIQKHLDYLAPPTPDGKGATDNTSKAAPVAGGMALLLTPPLADPPILQLTRKLLTKVQRFANIFSASRHIPLNIIQEIVAQSLPVDERIEARPFLLPDVCKTIKDVSHHLIRGRLTAEELATFNPDKDSRIQGMGNQILTQYLGSMPISWEELEKHFKNGTEVSWLQHHILALQQFPNDRKSTPVTLGLIMETHKKNTRDRVCRALCRLINQEGTSNLQLKPEVIDVLARDYAEQITNLPVDSESLTTTSLPLFYAIWNTYRVDANTYQLFINFCKRLFHLNLEDDSPRKDFEKEVIEWFIHHPLTKMQPPSFASGANINQDNVPNTAAIQFFRQVILANEDLGYQLLINYLQQDGWILATLTREEVLSILSRVNQITTLPNNFWFAYLVIRKLKASTDSSHRMKASKLAVDYFNNKNIPYAHHRENEDTGIYEGLITTPEPNVHLEDLEVERGKSLLEFLTKEDKQNITHLYTNGGMRAEEETALCHKLLGSFPNLQHLTLIAPVDTVSLPPNCQNLRTLHVNSINIIFQNNMPLLEKLQIVDSRGPNSTALEVPTYMPVLKELDIRASASFVTRYFNLPPRSYLPKLEKFTINEKEMPISMIPDISLSSHQLNDHEVLTIIPRFSFAISAVSSRASSSSATRVA